MVVCRYVDEKVSAAMLATKRSVGVAPELYFREHTSYMSLPSTVNAAHSGFKTQRRHHQKSKTGVSVALQNDMCPSQYF